MATHSGGPQHPERPARLLAVAAGVRAASGVDVIEAQPEPAATESLQLIHTPEYVAALERLCAAGGGDLDADTACVPASWQAARLAAGAGLSAVRRLRGREAEMAFLTVRPPGHHALSDQAMGFCLFNNVAVTAAELRRGGEKVAILDLDVHHGNGTQDLFFSDAGVLYVSFHQFPFYPGTGWYQEVGAGEAEGTTLNFPLPRDTAGDVYRRAMTTTVLPVLETFAPDWMLVSVGFDAHHADPLADLRLNESDYGMIAGCLTPYAARKRLIFFLEGGYHLPALERSAASLVAGAGGVRLEEPPFQPLSPPAAWSILEAAQKLFSRYWRLG